MYAQDTLNPIIMYSIYEYVRKPIILDEGHLLMEYHWLLWSFVISANSQLLCEIIM